MYNKEYQGDVCSHSHAFFLDNFLRRWFQNPKKIVGEYIRKGQTVVDLGCGPGFFSLEMAKMVGKTGRVYAVDLQKEMLEKVTKKARAQDLLDRIQLHNCPQDKIGLSDEVKADFILAYYMVHETPDAVEFLKEIKNLLKKGGRFLIVEPPFHVSKAQFQKLCADVQSVGLEVIGTPAKKGGRSVLATVS